MECRAAGLATNAAQLPGQLEWLEGGPGLALAAPVGRIGAPVAGGVEPSGLSLTSSLREGADWPRASSSSWGRLRAESGSMPRIAGQASVHRGGGRRGQVT